MEEKERLANVIEGERVKCLTSCLLKCTHQMEKSFIPVSYVWARARVCVGFVMCGFCNCVGVLVMYNTGLFISPSGISELDCATTKTDTAERSISIGTEPLQDFCTRGLGVLPGSTARG